MINDVSINIMHNIYKSNTISKPFLKNIDSDFEQITFRLLAILNQLQKMSENYHHEKSATHAFGFRMISYEECSSYKTVSQSHCISNTSLVKVCWKREYTYTARVISCFSLNILE